MTRQIILSAGVLTSLFLLSFSLEVGSGVNLVSHLTALMVVMGGTLSIALMVYPWRRLIWTARMVRKSFRPLDKAEATIQAIVHLARNYRQGWDIRLLERQAQNLPPGLLKTGVEMIAYQWDRDKMREVLGQETASVEGQYESARGVIRYLSQVALSLGFIGTVVNLVRSLGLCRDLQELAGYSAVAFLSFFYGVLLGRVGLIPLADRLKEYLGDERFRLELIREGILGIQDREHPRAIRFKLETYLAGRGAAEPIPQAPEIEAIRPAEVSLESKRISSILVN
jgi:chemotaxis protein MotA